MKITYWDVADASVLAQVYNQQVAGIPHCYPVSPEEFHDGLHNLKDDRHCELRSGKIIVGEEGGSVIGFAHVSTGKIEFSDRKMPGGLIHFLTYQPGHRPTGQAILTECEKYLRGLGTHQIWAFQNGCNYRFYHLGFGNVSDRMEHVYALFHINGYRPNEGEIFMADPEYSVAEPMPPDDRVEIVVEKEPGIGALPGLNIQILRGGKEIGVCECISGGECCQAREAQDWFFIEWLGVEPEEQGKGWGRYLLQRARWEMRRMGYRNAAISTDWKNYRALLFYTNYGYQVTDTVYGFTRKFSRG